MWSLEFRRLLPRSGLLALALSISALTAEIAVRTAMPQPCMKSPPGMLIPDPPRRFRLAPGLRGTFTTDSVYSHRVSINSLGMRGPEVGEKEPGTFRILAIGDSFTFGLGVEFEDTFAALAQEQLRSEVSGGVEVLIGGVPGFGLPDELAWFEQYGLQLEPDVVLINFCLVNDLFDATEGEINQEIYRSSQTANDWSLTSLLSRHSHLYRFVDRSTTIREFFGLPEPWGVSYVRSIIEMHTDTPTDQVLEGRRASRAALTRFGELAEQRDFRLIAMLIPNDIHVVPERWQRVLGSFGLDPAAYDPEAPRRFFLDILAENDIPVLDLWPLVQVAVENGERLYYKRDLHWTPAGHRLAAEALSTFMAEENLVGARFRPTVSASSTTAPAL